MSYEYKIATDISVYDQFRTILGVTTDEFSDDEIDLLPILPAAEREVIKLVPQYASIVEGDDRIYDLQLAVIYFAANNALPSLRFKMLEIESDNKTVAQRFRSALNPVMPYSQLALKYVNDVLESLAASGDPRTLFEISTPATNVITGEES